MTNPLILAGAKALCEDRRVRFLETDPNAPTWDECSSRTQATYLTAAEAVIRSLPNGDGLLAGTHAVLPVEATEEMLADGARAINWTDSAEDVYRAMVAAYLKAEKQG